MKTMREKWWLMLILATLGPTTSASEVLELEIMSYNIYWGGQDHYPAQPREDRWFDVIVREAPDLICLQECNGWLPQDDDLLSHYVDMLNAALPNLPPYHGVVADTRSLFDMVLITQYPILEWENIHSVCVQGEDIWFRHACLYAALDLHGERHHVFNCHFMSGWEHREEREAEARALMQLIAELPPGEMVWVAGDFNSYSPVDCDPQSPTQPAYTGSSGPAEMVGWEPVLYLLEAGFVDDFRERHPLELGYTKETYEFFVFYAEPVSRIDFTFHAPWTHWSVEEAYVLDDDLANLGSDHYPVLTRYTRPAAAEVCEFNPPTGPGAPRCLPNPVLDRALLRCPAPGAAPVVLDILTVEGRRVRSLTHRTGTSGDVSIWWDGTDTFGRRAPAGTYYVRPRGAATSTRLLLLAP